MKKIKRMLIIFLGVSALSVTTIMAAVPTLNQSFSGNVKFGFRDISSALKNYNEVAYTKTSYSVKWNKSTTNGGTGSYNVWFRVYNGTMGTVSSKYLIPKNSGFSNFSARMDVYYINNLYLQGGREHIGNPTETISGTWGFGTLQ